MRIQRPEDAYEKFETIRFRNTRGVCDLGDGYVAPGRDPKTILQISKFAAKKLPPLVDAWRGRSDGRNTDQFPVDEFTKPKLG